MFEMIALQVNDVCTEEKNPNKDKRPHFCSHKLEIPTCFLSRTVNDMQSFIALL